MCVTHSCVWYSHVCDAFMCATHSCVWHIPHNCVTHMNVFGGASFALQNVCLARKAGSKRDSYRDPISHCDTLNLPESRHAYECVISHICMSHGTHTSKACHTHEASRHTHGWVFNKCLLTSLYSVNESLLILFKTSVPSEWVCNESLLSEWVFHECLLMSICSVNESLPILFNASVPSEWVFNESLLSEWVLNECLHTHTHTRTRTL